MWNKPWKLKEGFLIGGGLLVVGLLLQIAVGPVRWERLAFPANVILLCIGLAAIAVMYALRKKVYLFEWLMHTGASVPAICYALGLTIVMGLVAQVDEGGIPWLSHMLTFWPFVLAYVWMMVIVGLVCLNHLLHFNLKEIPFLLNHLGVFLALVCGALGSPDKRELLMTLEEGQTQSKAEDKSGKVYDLDLSVELHDFIMEEYPLQPGMRMRMPKRFASEVTVHTKQGKSVDATIDVNKPLKLNGWVFYQYDYDSEAGTESKVSVLQMVKDPWLPFVYAGIYMMLAGAVTLIFFMAPRPKRKEE